LKEVKNQKIKKFTPWLLVQKRTIPTERPQLVGEVSANFNHLYGLLVIVPPTDPEVPGSIAGAITFSEKWWFGNEVHSDS
jgi:hypothetical protein